MKHDKCMSGTAGSGKEKPRAGDMSSKPNIDAGFATKATKPARCPVAGSKR